ncbi:type VII secretion-associated serine protease mycosin [Micromonospora sp. NPDC049559]|uniref:type VII secretion-associated serine protease mycosin n=1 Tax=Micromonospora sp. NPDC049559 TaxID=3155923 RepID=UPI0034317A45
MRPPFSPQSTVPARSTVPPHSTARGWSLRALVVALVAAVLTVPTGVPAAAAGCGPSFANPLPDTPWPLRQLRPDLVWPLTRGAGVTVAVIDSGVSPDHPALAGQVHEGYDFIQPSTHGTCDESGHGTMIAGIIAGRVTPNSGFHGIAPNAAILPVRVLRDEQKSFNQDDPNRIATAIRWAVDHGAKVVNLSLVTPRTAALDAAVQYAQDHDVVLVAAAGNEGGGQQANQPAYPAAYPGVIAVAGVDEQGAHVTTSTAGNYVDIAAPGKNIEGPAPNGGGYVVKAEGGTSFAAAYVSGVVALVRAYRTDLDAPSVVRRVLRTADHSAGGWDPDVGYGVVNPYWAVTSVAGNAEPPRPPAAMPAPRAQRDPLHAVRVAATWIGIAGVALAALVLLGVPVLRRGRRRGWRAGRESTPLPAEPASPRRDSFTPVVGRAMSVTAPSLQRGAGAPRAGSGGPSAAAARQVTMPGASSAAPPPRR